jgi:hypothetical protein
MQDLARDMFAMIHPEGLRFGWKTTVLICPPQVVGFETNMEAM